MSKQLCFLFRWNCLVLAFIACLITSQLASGQSQTFSYSGTIQDSFTGGSTIVLAGFPNPQDDYPFDAFNGQAISLSFSFDPNLVDNDNSPLIGDYSTGLNYEVQIGNSLYTSSGSGGNVRVYRGDSASGSRFSFSAPVQGPSISGLDFYSASSVILDFELGGSLFNTDSLPSIQPNPNQFSSTSLTLNFSGDFGPGRVGSDLQVILGDANFDGVVNFSDIPQFIAVLSSRGFLAEADIDENERVDFADIPPKKGTGL